MPFDSCLFHLPAFSSTLKMLLGLQQSTPEMTLFSFSQCLYSGHQSYSGSVLRQSLIVMHLVPSISASRKSVEGRSS